MLHVIVCQFNEVTIEEEDSSSPVKCPVTTRLVLETDEETKAPIIEVNKKLIRKLKPHQVDGVYLQNLRVQIICVFNCFLPSVL